MSNSLEFGNDTKILLYANTCAVILLPIGRREKAV